MEEQSRFRSDFYYDLPAFQEFNKLLNHSMGRTTFMNLLTMLSMLFLLTQLDNTITLMVTLILSIYFLLYHLFRYVRGRDGGVTYQQILRSNDDSIPHQIVTFGEEGIRSRNPRTGNDILDTYESVRYLMESENLLVLVTDQRMCHIVDKRFISGGSLEELIAYLRQRCPRLQKKIKNGKLGRIVSIALLVTAFLGLILGGYVLLRHSGRTGGHMSNDLGYREMAQELKTVGIVISDRTIQELEAYDAEYARENGDYYTANEGAVKIQDLLYWEGSGIYDQETWEWTPSESGIYWFDTEVWNAGAIYTDFLRGVDALSGDLTFTGVAEDYSAVDLEEGTGTVTVSFHYLGEAYSFEARYEYDWFDTEMLTKLGRVLASDQKPENLWYAYDGGQGICLYYGDQAQVTILEQKAGLEFHSCELASVLGQ